MGSRRPGRRLRHGGAELERLALSAASAALSFSSRSFTRSSTSPSELQLSERAPPAMLANTRRVAPRRMARALRRVRAGSLNARTPEAAERIVGPILLFIFVAR